MEHHIPDQRARERLEDLPDIVFSYEPAMFLTSVLWKTLPVSVDTPGDASSLACLRDAIGDGLDEESLRILALTKDHPEREATAFATLATHKSPGMDWRALQRALFSSLDALQTSPEMTTRGEASSRDATHDLAQRKADLPALQERLRALIAFYRPREVVKRITVLPSDPLTPKDSGAAFHFGQELVLLTHRENMDNMEHEFLHSLINPIVDAFSELATDEQKSTISSLANPKLRQDYGEGSYSLLCEELIRTYNDVIKHGRTPETIETFKAKLATLSEERFQRLFTEHQRFAARCETLGIRNLKDLEDQADEYFYRFEYNRLRQALYFLYHAYSAQDAEPFEDFFLRTFPRTISDMAAAKDSFTSNPL